MASVTLKTVTKKYGRVLAVDGMSLEIEDREFVVLVGPSGCGKTTVMRMVAGLEEITSGEIHIGERMVNFDPPKDRNVAMVFQNYALYPHMNVFQNMAFGLKLRKAPKDVIEQRVQEAARILDIGDLLDRKPRALSGGERQRVAVGRAIVRDPDVFLFDEPLSNLDAQLRTSMRGQLVKLQKKLQATTIYVTHDQVEAMTMGDRIVIMRHGVIQQVGAPLEVYGNPANLFVAGFIGSPGMNLFDGVLREEGGCTIFEADGLSLVLPDRLAAAASQRTHPGTVLGIRPEHISHRPPSVDQHGGSCGIPAQVEVFEPLGADVILELSAGKQTFFARLGADTVARAGDAVTVYLDSGKFSLFDAKTEQAYC